MTREYAITVLENEKKCFLKDTCEPCECDFCRLMVPEERILSAYDMAIAAIREQEERENQKPLTLDELRQMDGEPVWDNFLMEWCIIMMDINAGKGAVKYFDGGFNPLSEKRFYRSQPKEDA